MAMSSIWPIAPAFAPETDQNVHSFRAAVARYQDRPFLSRSGRTGLNLTREAVMNLADELEWARDEVRRLRAENERISALLTLALEAT
jgi:hypothetical protein